MVANYTLADSLTWCAYYNWNPWIYPISKDSYAGVIIDQLVLFKRNNPNIDVKPIVIDNWKRCQAEVASGHITMILGANKTPAREKLYYYLPEPAFINFSTVGVYTSADNDKVDNINKIDDLRQFRLVMVRGNSYGSTVDNFVKSLIDNKMKEVSNQGQLLKLVKSKRFDYFFLPLGDLGSTIDKYRSQFADLEPSDYRLVYKISRATPVFYVFGKKRGFYKKYADKWIATIKEYYNTVNFDTEVARHKAAKTQ